MWLKDDMKQNSEKHSSYIRLSDIFLLAEMTRKLTSNMLMAQKDIWALFYKLLLLSSVGHSQVENISLYFLDMNFYLPISLDEYLLHTSCARHWGYRGDPDRTREGQLPAERTQNP